MKVVEVIKQEQLDDSQTESKETHSITLSLSNKEYTEFEEAVHLIAKYNKKALDNIDNLYYKNYLKMSGFIMFSYLFQKSGKEVIIDVDSGEIQ